MALASYALQLANHAGKDIILDKFDRLAVINGDKKNWNKPVPESDKNSEWYSKPNSVNVEMTAYGLLAILAAGHFTDGLPVMKWLLSQRNDQGGFESTQDTVVGLQALAKFAEQISSKNNNIQIVASYGEKAETTLKLNGANAMILQSYKVNYFQ